MSLPKSRIAIAGTGVNNGIYRVGPTPFYDLPEGETIRTYQPRCNDSEFFSTLFLPPLLDFAEWKTWGTTWITYSSLYLEATCGDQKLCVKMAINLDQPQEHPDPEHCLPVSTRFVLDRLFKEANFYHDHLKDLQGITVPRHYGLWACHTSWAGMAIFSVFEWAGDPVLELHKNLETYTSEIKLLCMHRLRDLHDHRILHQQLVLYHDLRHILYDATTNTSRIVDFSCVEDHDCEGSYPPKGACWGNPQCCREVACAADHLMAFQAISEEAEDDETDMEEEEEVVEEQAVVEEEQVMEARFWRPDTPVN
ncbi:hypothetical protein ONZ45_g2692 [Pleurotus djamor]|nr:hypothetical protein ONZ45_g2692 [Pleurotus djamor]